MSAPHRQDVPYIGVIGPGEASPAEMEAAREIGSRCAKAHAVVVTGGLGGVMEAACQGAFEVGGLTVGILPGQDRTVGNRYLTFALATGLGELRNGLVVRACDVLIVVGQSWGTLSEMALALRTGTPVVSINKMTIDQPGQVQPEYVGLVDAAVERALELARSAPARRRRVAAGPVG